MALCASLSVCVFITAGPMIKLFAGPGGGGGPGEWRTSAMRDDEPSIRKFPRPRTVTSFKYSVFFVFLTHLCNVVNVYCNTRNTKLFAGELLSGGHVLRETTSRGLSGLAQADLS